LLDLLGLDADEMVRAAALRHPAAPCHLAALAADDKEEPPRTAQAR
jgi:hypothetical protein